MFRNRNGSNATASKLSPTALFSSVLLFSSPHLSFSLLRFLPFKLHDGCSFYIEKGGKEKKRDWWAGERLATAFNDGWMRNEEINYMEDSVQITFSGFKHLSFNLNFSQVILSDLKRSFYVKAWTHGQRGDHDKAGAYFELCLFACKERDDNWKLCLGGDGSRYAIDQDFQMQWLVEVFV